MKWKIRFYINIPEIVPYETGKFIGTFRGIEIFPEIEKKKGWFFDVYANGDDKEKSLLDIMPEIEEILDKLSFELFLEVSITEIIVFNVHQIFKKNDEELVPISDETIKNILEISGEELRQELIRYPTGIKNQRGMWFQSPFSINVMRAINAHITDTKLDSKDAKSLKWFIKGIGSRNDIDRFFAFYTSLELFAKKLNLDKVHPICKKCKKSIEHGNNCDHRILINPEQMEYLKKIGLKEDTAKKIKDLRDSFIHGGKDITNSELDELIDANIQLIYFLTMQFKKILGIPENVAPILSPMSMQMKHFGEIRNRAITLDILKEIKTNM